MLYAYIAVTLFYTPTASYGFLGSWRIACWILKLENFSSYMNEIYHLHSFALKVKGLLAAAILLSWWYNIYYAINMARRKIRYSYSQYNYTNAYER